MKRKISTKLSGIALAMATAGLVGCATSDSGGSGSMASASAVAAGQADLVHCYGVNKCQGHNDCKTSNNNCAGHASCKGDGFVSMPSKACTDIGGTTNDNWVGTVDTADLIHCYGVNKCEGHNDCKTASNACAGHASCKGSGFVSMSAKACSDVGGKSST